MADDDRRAEIEAGVRTSWVCDTCGWSHTFDEPMTTVYCVACFREGRGADVLCRLTFPLECVRDARDDDEASGRCEVCADAPYPWNYADALDYLEQRRVEAARSPQGEDSTSLVGDLERLIRRVQNLSLPRSFEALGERGQALHTLSGERATLKRLELLTGQESKATPSPQGEEQA